MIGDIHGLVPAYVSTLKEYIFRRDGYQSLQIGDFGYGDDYKRRDFHFDRSTMLDSEKHLFIGGNHDDYDSRPDFMLGDFGTLEVFGFENAFFIRGARSIDQDQRTEGLDWWRDEQLNYSTSKEALEAYVEAEPDIMITHEAPSSAAQLLFKNKRVHKSSTGQLLSAAFEEHKPKIWIFGHWHISRDTCVQGTRFICLDELETIEINNDIQY